MAQRTDDVSSASSPLLGRVALVTGVSRSIGIAASLAQRLHRLGATVAATGWVPHDVEMPWGEDPVEGLVFPVGSHNLEDPDARATLIDEVVDQYGRIDIVIAVHARSIDHALSAHGRQLQNPGPVDTGYAPPDIHRQIASMFPDGRWGTPTDVANLVAFLVSDEGAWIRGQVIDSEGGFRRW